MTANTIAVLPFVNLSADPENEFFSDGITEEIINALAAIEGLKVTSRTSSFYFKNKSVPLKEVAKQLGVAIILEGSVRVSGNTLRITAQLIKAEDDSHFWSEKWDRKLDNIFEIQDEISVLIADKLREQLGHFEMDDHLVEKQTESLDAYSNALKGHYHFNKWNPTDVQTAIDYYEKAIELDPYHTESYVGLADAYGFMATTEFMPREMAWKKASDFTQKAYELNPKNAGVHYQLANLAFFTQSDFKEAMRHGMAAVELKPNYPEAQQFVAFLYMLSGEMAQALDHLQRAIDIDPLSIETLFYKAYYHYRFEEFEKALHFVDECLAKNPKNIPAYIVRCYSLLKLQRYDEVLAFIGNMPDEIVIPVERLGITCLTYLLKNEKEKWEIGFHELYREAQKSDAFQAHSYLFLIYANQGKFDEAFEWLDKVIEMKSSILLLSYTDPLVNDLRNDPRYPEYKKKLYRQTEAVKQTRHKTPLLDHETADTYTSQLLNYMEQEVPYLSPGLTLRSLAAQLQIHPNQLSWVLNEKLGKNFNDFVNHYRVEHFKKLSVDPANSHISLIGLAYESGFNSKTVFNTYFKKETGMTPREFLKES